MFSRTNIINHIEDINMDGIVNITDVDIFADNRLRAGNNGIRPRKRVYLAAGWFHQQRRLCFCVIS
jgi:hypothetical protein